MGKGSRLRPVNRDKFSESWSKFFGKSEKSESTAAKLLCACDGRACKGVCREKNLYRKRIAKDMDRCPSAYKIEETDVNKR